MIGRTNAGSGKSVALIRVLYNAGTVCTCSNGTITFGSDISGDYLFDIPTTGNWTVSGQDSKGVAKSVTLTIAKGDGKLVTFDTMIPPEYRTTYQEVEYLRFYNANQSEGKVDLDIRIVAGSWDFEMENIILDEPTNERQMACGMNSSGLALSTSSGRFRLTINNDFVANKDFAFSVPHNLAVHWSSVSSEAKPTSLTVDGEEVISSATARSLTGNGKFSAGSGNGDGYQWNGKYGMIKVKKEGVLVRQCIPCKRRSDGMPGYFDLITNEFRQGDNNGNTALASVLLVITPGPAIGD